MARKSKTRRLIELLETIHMVNQILIDLHKLPILERVNKTIDQELKRKDTPSE